jgi:hypothetical protein
MTSKTIVRASVVAAGAVTAAVLAGTAAQAATGGPENRNPGMQQMHKLMQEGNPGMQQMHQQMQEGTSGMPGMNMGPNR